MFDWRKENRGIIKANCTQAESHFLQQSKKYSSVQCNAKQLIDWIDNGELRQLGSGGASKLAYSLGNVGFPNLVVKTMKPKSQQRGRFGNQLLAELNQYKQIIANNDQKWFVPYFLGFQRKNIATETNTIGEKTLGVCLLVKDIMSLQDAIDECYSGYKHSEMEEFFTELLDKYSLNDIWHHPDNSCIVNGHPAILDFGL